MESVHKTVLLNETIEGLNLKPNSTVIDCTFGGGGHSAEICLRYPGTKIIALDRDESAFEKARSKFSDLSCNVIFKNMNFRDMEKLRDPELFEKVDGIVFDLGLSSDQLENSGRGFSFRKDEPLLMTMKANLVPEDVTAGDIVNHWKEETLANIIFGYGEERYSRRIAKGIIEARKKGEIKTTSDLVKIIENSVPAVYRRGKTHFATRTFQALRIAVNDELQALEDGLIKGFDILRPGGRMAVISFHSLEDRRVKRFFREVAKNGEAKLINKKPIIATNEETKINPRSRSAKLRILEKVI